MPYYQVIFEGPFQVRGERETIAEVYDRPLSFVGRHEFGRRQFLLLGKKAVRFDVESHDRGTIIALRDVTVLLRRHQTDLERKVVDLNELPAVMGPLTAGDGIVELRLRKGQKLPLYKTSFSIEGKRNEQVTWDPDMEGADFFGDICIAAIKKGLGSGKTRT